MVEKRPFPGDHSSPNGTKRPRAGDPAPAAMSIQDRIAAAKAKAAALKVGGGSAAATNGAVPVAPRPSTQSPSSAPAAGGDNTLAAIRARMAAAMSSRGGPTSTFADSDTPSKTESTTPRFATTLGNRRTESPMPERRGEQSEKQQEKVLDNPYYDPDTEAAAPRARVSRGLLFNQRGKYLDQASRLRQLNRLEQIKAQIARQARLAGLDENSERNFIVAPPPEVEWWDEGLLEDKTYDCIDDPTKLKIDADDSIITIYVQHPSYLRAAQEKRLVEVKPMYLTSKEQAKLRRMRRAADLKEHQAKIRLGLEPPPPPKVKRGNMMRVMGEQAIADPTAVEMLVEAQIKDRQQNHERTNDERKLTKEERLSKLNENQQKDAKKGLYLCVFKVNSLAYGKHRYQIDHNAKQHALTGITIFNPQMNLVIVEGGAYAIDKYKKLMLRRIKWTENAPPSEAQEEKQARDPQWMKSLDDRGVVKDLSFNSCKLVFEGEVDPKKRTFRKWGSRVCETDGEAREVLSRTKLDSLWALAKSSE